EDGMMRKETIVLAIVLAIVAAATLAGCRSDGRSLAEPRHVPRESAGVDAGAPRVGEIDAIAARVRAAVDAEIAARKNVGVVVALSLRGERRFLSFGNPAPNETTVFEIGSITKTFTGLLLADAIERGVVRQEDRLDAVRPEWKASPSGDIRLIDLVTHRSG